MIYLNDEHIEPTMFPDNTSQIWKIDEDLILSKGEEATIGWNFTTEGEFMQVAQLKMLLDTYNLKTTLYLKYVPYARQDKEISKDTTFALHTFGKLINSLNFTKVIGLDPHSHVCNEVIHNFYEKYPDQIFFGIRNMLMSDIICYPDFGAKIKYNKQYLGNFNTVYGEKKRNQLTGYIEEYKLHGDVKDKNVLIFDDICDGGMTFILLTKQLLEAGAKEVNLFVTHGIFSKGLRCLKDAGIKRIFTYDGEVSEVQNQIAYRTLWAEEKI